METWKFLFSRSQFYSFRSIDSGPNTPLPFGVGGGGDDAESSGGFSIHSLSKMAATQRQARVLIAAAAMGSQIATMEELTKNWVTGAPTSIQFLGKFCKVLATWTWSLSKKKNQIVYNLWVCSR